MDNRKYRLNNSLELAVYQKDMKRFNKFVNRVYNFLDSLRDGESVVVDEITDEKTIDIFIKVVCLYISYRNPRTFEDSYIIFSDDYLLIKRVPGFKLHKRYRNFFYEDK